MTYTNTTNKSLQEPASGDLNWDVNLNYNFTALDKALGGIYAATFTTSNQTIAITTAANYQNLIINATGAYTGGIITIPPAIGGMWIINNATSGNLTFKTSGSGATVTVPVASQTISYADAAGNVSQSNTSSFHYNSGTGLFEGFDGTSWVPVTGGATGGGNDQIFFQNGQNVTTNYSIPSGKNAMTAGPVTIDSGITVTIPSGSVWTIV